jgi:sec-independent protein translocase protein TatA
MSSDLKIRLTKKYQGGRMFGLGTGELILIGIVAFIFVGPQKLPKLGAALAQSITNFKKGMREISQEENQEDV